MRDAMTSPGKIAAEKSRLQDTNNLFSGQVCRIGNFMNFLFFETAIRLEFLCGWGLSRSAADR